MRTSKQILKELVRASARETSRMEDFQVEVDERLKDLRFIEKDWSVGSKVLLVGTSDSEIEAWYKKFNSWPAGISLERWKNQFIVNEDIHETSFNDEYFDFVYASQILEHSPAPMIALSQICRVLKRGGKFFFWIPFDWDNQKVEYHYSCFSPEIWVSLIKKSRLEVDNMYYDTNSFGYYGHK